MKKRNIHFIENLTGAYPEFYQGGVVIVLRTQSVSAVFCPPVSFTTHQVLKYVAIYEKNEQVQQANVFRHKQ